LTQMHRHAQVMILTHDKERGRISLSTKKLEPSPGDMLRNPALVFAKADEMAAVFKCALDCSGCFQSGQQSLSRSGPSGCHAVLAVQLCMCMHKVHACCARLFL